MHSRLWIIKGLNKQKLLLPLLPLLEYHQNYCIPSSPSSIAATTPGQIKFAQANTKLYNRDIVLVQDTLLSISILEKLFFNSSVLKNQNLPRKKSCNDEIRGDHQTIHFKLIETFRATIKINTCNSNINF